MTAEIISIGDELLIGQVVNTNASWMAEQLTLYGIEISRIVAVADIREEIIASLREASLRANVVLITGGLGPTRDDITKDTLCEYFDSTLIIHEPSLQYIEKFFKGRGLPLREINRRQASIPDNCTPLINSQGSAPGMWFEKEGVAYISLPGVPYEMRSIMSEHVLPALASKLNGAFILHKVIMTQGVGESFLSEKISRWEDGLPAHMKLAYLPQPGIVRLRLTATGKDKQSLTADIEKQITALVSMIPDLIYGYDEASLEEVTGILLRESSLTLATAESCTGGYIAHLLTSIAGSSAYFKGSVIAYSNEIKTGILGVQEETLMAYGAVSEQTVIEMAEGVRARLNTDYAIAVSGIAGPDGGTPEKAVGTTWISVAGTDGCIAKKYLFGNNRQRNIRLAAVTALNRLRLKILSSRSNN